MTLLRKYKIWKLVGYDKDYHEMFYHLEKIINNLYTKDVIINNKTYYYKDSFIFNINNNDVVRTIYTFSTYIQSMILHNYEINGKIFMELVLKMFENQFQINIDNYKISNSVVIWL